MGHYSGNACRLCRKDKNKLFLKGEKCATNCVLDRGKRKNPPGEHVRRRMAKISEYNRHLQEKQKVKYIFGLNERQLRNYFRIASKMKGLTGENLLLLLERRLDNVIHKLGFTSSMKFASQLVTHRHVLVNNRVRRASGYLVKIGDEILLKEKIRDNIFVKKSIEQKQTVPSWVELDTTNFVGKVVSLPTRQDVSYPVNETLIVEFYSR